MMNTLHLTKKGWPLGHPFFLALFAVVACTQNSAPNVAPVTVVDARPTCPVSQLATSSRFSVEPLETGLPKRGQWRDGFDVADMNGDGVLDVLHGPARKGNFLPVIFLGDGKGQFAPWKEAHFPPLPYDYGDAKAGDVNGDGKLDIAVASHLRGLAILVHEANGSYAPWGEGLVLARQGTTDEPPFASRSIALVDWNLDRRLDLVAIDEGPARLALAAGIAPASGFALFLNRGGFFQRMEGDLPAQFFGRSLAIGDVNGDRRPDALAGTEVAGFRRVLFIGTRESWKSHPLDPLPPNAAVTATALHDFDRDRRDELLYAARFPSRDGFCTTLDVADLHRDDTMTATLLWSENSRNTIVAMQAIDLDGNLQDDLVALRDDGTLLFFAANANGFTRDITIETPQWLRGCEGYDLHAADIDGDGKIELIASYAGEGAGSCASGGGFAAWRVNSPR